MNTKISQRYETHIILLQPQARERAEKEGFEISIAKTSFKANTKALAENEAEGLAKVIMFSLIAMCLVETLHDCMCIKSSHS